MERIEEAVLACEVDGKAERFAQKLAGVVGGVLEGNASAEETERVREQVEEMRRRKAGKRDRCDAVLGAVARMRAMYDEEVRAAERVLEDVRRAAVLMVAQEYDRKLQAMMQEIERVKQEKETTLRELESRLGLHEQAEFREEQDNTQETPEKETPTQSADDQSTHEEETSGTTEEEDETEGRTHHGSDTQEEEQHLQDGQNDPAAEPLTGAWQRATTPHASHTDFSQSPRDWWACADCALQAGLVPCNMDEWEDRLVEAAVPHLLRWTGLEGCEKVYDSAIDAFAKDAFYLKTINRRDIVVVAVTADDDVFGGYVGVAVDRCEQAVADPSHFLFSLEAHGRCAAPCMFPRKEECRDRAAVRFCRNHPYGFLVFGPGLTQKSYVFLGNMQADSYCNNLSREYVGIADTTLTGKNGYSAHSAHRCRRLLVLQLS